MRRIRRVAAGATRRRRRCPRPRRRRCSASAVDSPAGGAAGACASEPVAVESMPRSLSRTNRPRATGPPPHSNAPDAEQRPSSEAADRRPSHPRRNDDEQSPSQPRQARPAARGDDVAGRGRRRRHRGADVVGHAFRDGSHQHRDRRRDEFDLEHRHVGQRHVHQRDVVERCGLAVGRRLRPGPTPRAVDRDRGRRLDGLDLPRPRRRHRPRRARRGARARSPTSWPTSTAPASRFRDDSELAALDRAGGAWTPISPLLPSCSPWPCAQPGSPTATSTPRSAPPLRLGYDRDVEEIPRTASSSPVAGPGLAEHRTGRATPAACGSRPGVRLDLGATAKAWTADTAAGAITAAHRQRLPGLHRWRHRRRRPAARPGLADPGRGRHRPPRRAAVRPGPVVTLAAGGLATSSTRARRWQRDGLSAAPPPRPAHRPAAGPGLADRLRPPRTAASTPTRAQHRRVVRGDRVWPLSAIHGRRPCRLVTADGQVLTAGGWPEDRAA